MSEESTTPDLVELVRHAVEAANARELDALMRLYAPDAVLDVTRIIGIAPQGRAAIRGHAEDWMGAFEELELVLEEPLDLGYGVVFTVVHQKGRPSVGTTGYVEQREGWVWVGENDLLVRQTIYPDIDEGRAAAERLAEERGQAMSQENVELAREVLDMLGKRDPVRLIELSDPEVEWHSFFALGEGGVYRGHEGTRRYMRDLADAWEVGRAEVDDALGIADFAILVGRIHFRGRGSGVESAASAGWMLKFRDGKLLRFRAFREPAQVLEAVGLVE